MQFWDLVSRFALGGSMVSAFAALAETLKPKTFSGLFAAAPTVAVSSLALAFHRFGSSYVAHQARAMICGGLALVVYGCLCVWTTRRRSLPVWLGALLNWLAWFAVAGAGWACLSRLA